MFLLNIDVTHVETMLVKSARVTAEKAVIFTQQERKAPIPHVSLSPSFLSLSLSLFLSLYAVKNAHIPSFYLKFYLS